MADRRMFSKSIIDSDLFLDMPKTAQALYFHLAMRADDDGFLGNVKKIMRMISANEDDYRILVAKSFIIQFDDGICVITHWRIHNYIQKDRYKETIYLDQKNLLNQGTNGVYTLDTDRIQNVSRVEAQVRLGKVSLDIGEQSPPAHQCKDAKSTKASTSRFEPPSVENVMGYCQEKGYENVDAERFVDFYASKGWYVGKNKMKDWKAAVRNWARQEEEKKKQNPSNNQKPSNQFQQFPQREVDYDALILMEMQGGDQPP